ncbi:hypothetical protein GLT90_01300 [Nanohaloarchaea archaeon H12]|nr:hypothetical protein [Nanohaloarchaea archaeon H12]
MGLVEEIKHAGIRTAAKPLGFLLVIFGLAGSLDFLVGINDGLKLINIGVGVLSFGLLAVGGGLIRYSDKLGR